MASMADTDGVLAAIDACMEDYAVSPDAMRSAPDTRFTSFPDNLARAARAALDGEVDEREGWRTVAALQLHLHTQVFNTRKHYRRCRDCNPAGNPKGMSINRGEYHRRRRRRIRP